jgi:hypothetical protein
MAFAFLLKTGAMCARQPLDRDDPVEPCIPRFPNLAHAARADGSDQHVRPDLQLRCPHGHGYTVSGRFIIFASLAQRGLSRSGRRYGERA